jgi:Arc/MetJ-type ribon-helix-helix transcriptional regulator
MNFELTPSIQKFVNEQGNSGKFTSPDAVLEEALTRMMEEEATRFDEETLAAIDESEDQIVRSECRDWKEVSAELRAKYLKK